MHKQQGWPQAWEYFQVKLIQTLGRASQEVNWSWSQCIKSHHAQTSSGKELPRHFWTRNIIRSILPGLKEKKNRTVAQWSKQSPLFRWKYILHLIWKSRSVVWRKTKETQNPSCLKSSVKFPKSMMIWGAVTSAGVGPLHFIKSKVHAAVYQEILEYFILYTSSDVTLAPAHRAKTTSKWFADLDITVFDWPANMPDLNPIENIWDIFKRKMRNGRYNNTDELKTQ